MSSFLGSGSRSIHWKGDDAQYMAAHRRAKEVLPAICAHADDTCVGQLEAAFKHDTPAEFVKIDPRGRRYSPRPEHYMRLCHSHHQRYDEQAPWKPEHARRARFTHCKHGHEFTPENTRIRSNGRRCCRICVRAAKRAAREGRVT